MKTRLLYIDATPADSGLLTRAALLSKKSWGYPDELMELWKPDLEINEACILNNKVVKVFEQEEFIGFFGLKAGENQTLEIDHLWLLPGKLGKGNGREIFTCIMNFSRSNGYTAATLIAEPNARGFYDKMGGKVTGQVRSKVSGRFLDIYEFR